MSAWLVVQRSLGLSDEETLESHSEALSSTWSRGIEALKSLARVAANDAFLAGNETTHGWNAHAVQSLELLPEDAEVSVAVTILDDQGGSQVFALERSHEEYWGFNHPNSDLVLSAEDALEFWVDNLKSSAVGDKQSTELLDFLEDGATPEFNMGRLSAGAVALDLDIENVKTGHPLPFLI